MTLQELKLRLTADVSNAQKGLETAGGHVNKFGGIVKAIVGAAAVTAMVSFGKSCINAAGEAEQGETLLRSSLGNIKGMTDAAKNAAVDWVNKMESSKSFDDSEISAALQRMALKTGDLASAQELVSVSMEVARNKNVDLATATGLVDQAYNGSARALKTFGIEIGPDGEAQKGMAAIHALQEKVKGSGDAWSQTLAGQKAAMATTFGNFQETIGGILMPLATELMKQIMPLLNNAMEWITDHMPEIQRVVTAVVNGIGTVFKAIGPVFKWIVDGIKDVIGWVEKVIEAIGRWLDQFKKTQQTASEGLSGGAASGNMNGTNWRANPTGAHANGGWVGLHGPEVSLVGERGPEYIVPNGGESPDSALLRRLIGRVDALIATTERVAPAMAASLNGIGRGS